MRQDFTIGIDCGSTTTKAVIFSKTGGIVGTGRRRVPQHTDEPRHVERDMHEAWQAVVEAVREALDVSGLSLSLIHISEPTRHFKRSRMPSSA